MARMRPILLQGHERSLTQIKFNAEGDLLFSCSKDHIINVWFSHNGERLGTYDGHNGTVWTIDVDSQSKFMVSGSADNTLKLWSVSTGKCLYTWEFPTAVKRVAFSDDDEQVVCITEQRMGYQGAIRVFNINREGDGKKQSLEPAHMFNPIGSKATVCAFTYLPGLIVTGHESGKVALFDIKTGDEVLNNERAHMDVVTDLQLSSDRTYFVTSSKDKTARIHDTKTLMVIKTYSTETPLNSAALAPNRPYVLLGGGQEAMSVTTTSTRQGKFETRFWHKVFEEEVGRVKGHFGPINTIAVHPAGNCYASGGEDGFVRVHHFDDSYFRAKPYGDIEVEDLANDNVATSLEGTSRKRRRTSDEEWIESDHVTASLSEPARDTKYYMDGGDCIILVEETLFKVHKAFLSRDSSTFEGMFSVPQGDSNVDGGSDQQPITLRGDTVEQFRSLVFILYALPHQIEALLLDKVTRFPELLTIAEITHKYHFAELGSWAVQTVESVFCQTTVSQIYHERLLRLATVTNDTRLYETFVSTLIERLMDGTLAPTETLIMADRLQIHNLQGVAYYAQLLALEKNNGILFPPGCPLNRDQRVRLLAGYMSLAKRWDYLRDNPLDDPSPTCSVHMNCRNCWDKQWRSHVNAPQVTQHSAVDILGKLQVMQTLLQTSFPPQNFHPMNNFMQPNQFLQLFQQQQHHQQNIAHAPNPAAPMNPIPQGPIDWNAMSLSSPMTPRMSPRPSPACIERAMAATKALFDEVQTSLLHYFSEDALGLTQRLS
ncbi:hypothetical protein PILCRDRAFT_89277 [Piloderma croceum F 1598]|uniref:Eukaryotic translation initiation factor 3 subunit I n=1 Tax=Piloderma croceum (strain F 1598) TaxID=765440 RepID=A0A0C3FMG4_PILCF|nr:hypothetical protein PILCRDRAFT_89277 [Piloderma croceum F 1598]